MSAVSSRSRLNPMRRAVAIASAALVALVAVSAQASAVDRISKTPGFNARSWTLTQSDANGVRYVGGDFSSYNAWNTGVAAVVDTTTGEVDPSFPLFDGWPYVQKVISDGTGGFYITGVQSIGGTSVTNLGHVLSSGAFDTGFRPTITGGRVETLAMSGTTLLVGGGFTSVNSTTRNHLAALDPQGALLSWNPNVTGGPVQSIAIDGATSTAYIAGAFNSVSGQTRNKGAAVPLGARPASAGTCLASYDATECAPTGFDPNVAGYAVFDLAVDNANSTVYLAGEFTSVGGSAHARLAAVDSATGALDTGWDPSPDGQVMTVTVDGSRVYAGGYFGTIAGESRGWVASFATTGVHAIDAWNPNAAMGAGCQCGDGVYDIQVVGGTTYLAGNFWSLGGVPRNRVGAVDTTTGIATSWNPHVGDRDNGGATTVWSIAVAGTKTMFGGTFKWVGGMRRDHVAAIGPDGVLTDWAPAVNGSVSSFGVLGDTIYMVGGFSRINGQPRQLAAAVKMDGTLMPWNPLPSGDRPVMVVTAPGKVYIGGFFDRVGGEARMGVAALDPITAAVDMNFDGQLDGALDSLAVQGSRLYVGGRFSHVGSVATGSLVALNATTGALDTGWNAGTLDGCPYVFSLAIYGNRLFAGGCFDSITTGAGTIARKYVAAFDTTTGAVDQNWDAHLTGGANMYGGVLAIAPTANVVYLGGSGAEVDPAGAETRTGLAAVDATTGALLPWRADTSGEVRGISASDAAVYVAGSFGTVGSEGRNNTAAIGTDGTVLAPWPMDPTTNRTLSVQMAGTGIVESAPGGIKCGDSCQYAFGIGSTVTLAAQATGPTFTRWSGACTGSTTTCTVTVDVAKSVVAHFADESIAPDPAPDPTPAPDPGASIGNGATGEGVAAPQSGSAEDAVGQVTQHIASLVGRPRSTSAHGRTAFSGLRITLPAAGRYTLIFQDALGARVPLAKGTKIQSRTLNKTFYAPVMHVTGPDALTLSAVLARPSARALTLRVVLRHPDGTLSGENIPLG